MQWKISYLSLIPNKQNNINPLTGSGTYVRSIASIKSDAAFLYVYVLSYKDLNWKSRISSAVGRVTSQKHLYRSVLSNESKYTDINLKRVTRDQSSQFRSRIISASISDKGYAVKLNHRFDKRVKCLLILRRILRSHYHVHLITINNISD